MIDWRGSKISEPPLTKNMTEEDIECYIVQKNEITFEVFPCHIQAVKRIIKEVTDVSLNVLVSETQNNYSHCTIIILSNTHSTLNRLRLL